MMESSVKWMREEKTMDLIDRNIIGDLVDANGNVHYEDIMNIPSLDIIHCKDCKYWQDQEEGEDDGFD